MTGIDSAHGRRAIVRGTIALAIAVALLASARGAAAAFVTVGCAAAPENSYDFASLGEALTYVRSLSPRDHVIQVSGTCTEVIQVQAMENVLILGTDGAALEEPPGSPLTYAVLAIVGSTAIAIDNLTLRGSDARRALALVYDSTAELSGCILENSGEGIFVHGASNVFIRRSIFQDLTWYGVRVDENASVSVGDVKNDVVPTVIRRNGNGVIARGSGVASLLGATSITENNIGISGQGGTVSFCCESHEREVTDNQVGLSLQAGSKLIVEGPLKIEHNLQGGIILDGASGRFWWGDYAIRNNGPFGIAVRNGGSVHLTAEGVIEDHPVAGVSLVGGVAALDAKVSIRNNGTLGRALSGGIVAASGSMVSLSTGDGSVTGNHGPGLLVTHNSTARVARATISSNGGEGVRVAALSSVFLVGANSIMGNAGVDLLCAPNSFGSGDNSGVGRMICPGFDRSPWPGGPNDR